MEEILTIEMIRSAKALLEKHQVKGDYILIIHPSRLGEAVELGLCPFCPLDSDDFIIEIS